MCPQAEERLKQEEAVRASLEARLLDMRQTMLDAGRRGEGDAAEAAVDTHVPGPS